MPQYLLPGYGVIDETGSGQFLLPGYGALNESQSGSTTINCSVGNAVADGSTASISGGGSVAASVGNAVADGMQATITNNSPSITTEAIINNAGTILASTSVVWTWFPAGRIGTLEGITQVDGTGTTETDGTLIATGGLSAGDGILLVAVQNTDETDDYVYYYPGTVA